MDVERQGILAKIPQFIPFLRPPSPEQKLANARHQLDIAWRELGGSDGKQVTKEQIYRLLAAELQVVNAEIHPISLAEELEKAQALDSEDSLRFTGNWLAKQRAKWRKRWLLQENNHFEHRELQRRIISCSSAIELLTGHKATMPIA